MKNTKETDRVLALLSEFKRDQGAIYGIKEMGVFGSFARGEAGDNSDIDIWVITETPNPYNIVHLKEKLEELLERTVDIIRIWDMMNPYLRDIISKEGLSVQ